VLTLRYHSGAQKVIEVKIRKPREKCSDEARA
jgi:hypothetical protein